MAKLEREPKDPQRKQRAELVRAATAEEWQARPGSKLEKAGRDGLKLVLGQAPEFILDADGEIVGVDAWVQLLDERGRELPIDPHRRIINPPTVPRAGIREVDTGRTDKRGNPVKQRTLLQDPVAAFYEAVWDSVLDTPNAKGWRTRGTVTTVFGDTADGLVKSKNSVYTTARSGGGTFVVDTTTATGGLKVAQIHPNSFLGDGTNYEIWEACVSFDTSAITDSDAVSAVDLALYLPSPGDFSSQDFTIEARDSDWGATVTSADFIAGASLSGLTLLASIATSGIGSGNAYKAFTSETAFLTATNLKTGAVHVLLSSSRTRLGNTPSTTEEEVDFNSADSTGTTTDPKLTITHAAAANAMPFFTSRPNRIWRLG